MISSATFFLISELQGKIRTLILVSLFSMFSLPAFAQADTTPTRDNNMALGNPSSALTAPTDSNNYLLIRSQYALSYNNSKGMANWVSWHLSPAWKGTAARCNCFTSDALLPAGYFKATTSDYTGTGFDRGHICPSDDRDGSDTDNAATFKMSNISPQAPVLNQQTWGDLENYCRTLLNQGKELYITAGGYGNGGTGSLGGTTTSIAGGTIKVPAYFWKVIVVLSVDTNDVGRIDTFTRVITVLMPNNQTLNSHSWEYYRVTVDTIETLTGYDFLKNVNPAIQSVIEARVDNGPASLIAWDFTNANTVTTWAATSVDNNLDTAGGTENIVRGSTAVASAGANSFRSTGFRNDGISTANSDYFQVQIKAKTGYMLSLTTIDATYNGTGSYCTSPGVSQQFAYSLDGSTFTLIGSPFVTIGSPSTMNTVDISEISALQHVPSTQSIYLRYYASGQTTTGGWGFYSSDTGNNGLAINGTVAPVGAITGATTLCAGNSITLSDASPGGTWTSGATGVATVGSLTGIVSGIAAGTAMISYSISGISVTTIVTVNSVPAGISGVSNLCVGAGATLSNAVTGGTWTSNATGIVSINPTGEINGISAGVATISYNTGCGTTATYVVTATALPGAINGASSLCTGASITLTDNTAGGTWSSSVPAVGSIDAWGLVSGLSPGTTTINYSTGCGSAATLTVTVNAVSAGMITGASAVNVGANITLTDVVAGGTWSASNSNATVSGGVVTGVSSGTVTISYTVSNSCGSATATKVITVGVSSVGPITGAANVCVGYTTALTDVTAGGTWSSSNTFVATIATSGVVTGIAPGTATISYTVAGIASTILVTVNANPSGIGGASAVCTGSTISVSDFTPGGAWSSSGSASIVSTGSTTGLVTGVSTGTAVITYSLTTGCYRTYNINVNTSPAPISGSTLICIGGSTFLTDATPGGVSWTSSNTSVATISFSGSVVSVSAGTTTITYTISGGCKTTTVVTVNTAPAAITGNAPVCQSATLGLSDATGGGVWTSSNTLKATVNASGLVTGVSAGTAMITYSTGGSGCKATTVVTVNPLPNPGTISGASTVCTGSVITVSDATGGGVWSSGSIGVASVMTTGVVTGVSAGTATISYTATNSCGTLSATIVVTVSLSAAAGPITGTASVCAGATTNLSNAVAGGTWSSGATGIATVSSGGIVTGVATGIATITYTVPGGCGVATATRIVTVTSVTAGTILGASTVYIGSGITLSDATTGGIWAASNGNATVTSGGAVTGVSAGSVTISYSVTNSCGTATATKVVTVNISSVAPITGMPNICVGLTTALSDITPGGVWSSSNTLTATVSTSGVVTGVAAGTATISYTVAGVPATVVVTVSTNPSGIGSASSVCVGSSITVSDFTPGGSWSSTSNVSIASTGSLTGLVTGLSAGTSVITYALGSGCYRTFPITVNAAPAPISGTLTLCAGGGKTFVSDAVTPGVSWTSGTTSVATITASGVVTGVGAGTSIITYTIGSGCRVTATVTVNPLPVVAAISGPSTVSHAGPPIMLTDATGGGVWSSTVPAVATVGSATGVVTAIASSGSTTISYKVTVSGCVGTATKVVTASAAPHVHGIKTPGVIMVNTDDPVSLADDMPGGIWSSSNNDVATVDDRGMVTALTAGVADIVHTTNGNNGELYLIATRVVVNGGMSDIRILPNPNNGTFTVKGKLAAGNGEASLKITDMLGQTVYQGVIKTQDGTFSELIKLGNDLANGIYILNVNTGSEHSVFHFVIRK